MPTYKYVVDNLKQLEVNGYNIFGDIFHLDKKAGRLVIKSYPGTADHLLNHQELISKCFEGYEKAEKHTSRKTFTSEFFNRHSQGLKCQRKVTFKNKVLIKINQTCPFKTERNKKQS